MSGETPRQGDGIEPTLWRFLREVYLRCLTFGTLHPAEVMTVEEQNAALELHWRSMETDLATLMTVVSRARQEESEVMRAALHRAEGLDHEMVDEAVEWALAKNGEETQGE